MELKLKILTNNKSKALTLLRSLVEIKVVGKLDRFDRVLVEGRLYITQLPVRVDVGEVLIGSIIKKNPLTIALDSLVNYKTYDETLLKKILLKLRIEITQDTKNAVKLVLQLNKALIKSKINILVHSLQRINSELNQLEKNVLVKLIWDFDKNTLDELIELFSKSFDISFEAIAQNIYKAWLSFKAINYPADLIERLDKTLVVNFDLHSRIDNTLPFKNKTLSFIELYETLEDKALIDNYKSVNIENLKSNISKYICQKIIFHLASVYPDFAIVVNNNKNSLFLYQFETMEDSNHNKSHGVKIKSSNGGSLIGLLTDKNFYGELTGIVEDSYAIKEKINSFSINMLETYGLLSNIKIININKNKPEGKQNKYHLEKLLVS